VTDQAQSDVVRLVPTINGRIIHCSIIS